MSAPDECLEIETWDAHLETALPPDQSEAFARHLESCVICQKRIHQDEDNSDEWREMGRQLGDPTIVLADPNLVRVMARLHEAMGPDHGGPVAPVDLYFLRPTDRSDILGTFANYEVKEVIGQGGMGVVLKAYEPALHRDVAIKVMAVAVAGSVTARRRFTREAQAAAAVCHENIVPVYGVSEADGLPYLVMQYVAGESLQDRLDRAGPLKLTEIVRIGLQTARGLAAAHGQGLIHRDIKPANLLLETDLAHVKITDFGLARMVDDVTLTQYGVVAGTPEYMAPEQARAEPVDHRADLFSFGSVLYAMCTGGPPFRGSSVVAILRQVSDENPTSVRTINPEIPDWLEAIIARLQAKDPAERFQSAAEVATLLEGYIADPDKPVLVLPPASKRHRKPSRLVSFFLSIAGLIILAMVLAVLAPEFLPQVSGPTTQTKDPQAEPDHVWSVAISRNGKTLAAGAGWWNRAGEIGLWDVASRKPLHRFEELGGIGSLAFSPDGKWLASGSWNSHVRVQDWAAGKEVADFQVMGMSRVAFSPDGSLLATASEGKTLQLWDVAKSELMAELQGDLVRFQCVQFSIDGKRLLAGGGDWKKGGVNLVAVWEVASKDQVLKLTGHENTIMCVACSPDGKTIATGSRDKTLRLWDADTGKHLKTLTGHVSAVESVVYSPDSKTLISSGNEPTIRIWDVEQGKETGQINTQMNPVRALNLAPDGKTLVAGGGQKMLKVFDMESRQEVAVLWGAPDAQKTAMAELPAAVSSNTGAGRSLWKIKIVGIGFAGALVAAFVLWFCVRRSQARGKTTESLSGGSDPAEPELNAAKISFSCSACGTRLKVKPDFAGKKVKCSRCAQHIIVPANQAGKPEMPKPTH
jgi:eukaryotic-like serine/threonine-protein kinase